MRELNRDIKLQAIRLFLREWTLDEIAQQLGIAKGSVVNIVNDYREGRLSLPADMTEYVDSLRRTAVDLRKYQTTVFQVQACIRIQEKIAEMGVDKNDVIRWLDVSRDIASSVKSDGHFVKCALELARLHSETGLGYEEIIADYKEKNARRNDLKKEIDEKITGLNEIRHQHEEEEKRANRQLGLIKAQTEVAQDNFSKEKDKQQAELDRYLKQHKLSMTKVNTALAIFDNGSRKAGLAGKTSEALLERINKAGSLMIVIQQLERDNTKLLQEAKSLKQREKEQIGIIDSLEHRKLKLKQDNEGLEKIKSWKEAEITRMDQEIKEKSDLLVNLMTNTKDNAHNIYITQLIIDFLTDARNLDKNDITLDRIAGLILAVRQKRLGAEIKWLVYSNGYGEQCPVTKMHGDLIYVPEGEIYLARKLLAKYLMPLVEDEFISKREHESLKSKAVLEAIRRVRR